VTESSRTLLVVFVLVLVGGSRAIATKRDESDRSGEARSEFPQGCAPRSFVAYRTREIIEPVRHLTPTHER